MERKERQVMSVCVTGAGGYVASWLVKLLLSRGYTVHATLRATRDEKTAHLKQLENASQNLQLFKADILDCDALARAIEGCEGVFHLASPVPANNIDDPESEIVAPAVSGTLNVLRAWSSMKVRRVVVVSSAAAILFNPNWPQDRPRDESCWSDKAFLKKNEQWYPLAKTLAEEAALDYAEQNGLDVVTVCPSVVVGPLLQPMVNATSSFSST